MSLAMARVASSDGIRTIACTPHILPGVYHNTGPTRRPAVARVQETISSPAIPIPFVPGGVDNAGPGLGIQFRGGRALALTYPRFLLLEPPHHLLPPRLEDLIFGLQAVGYI